MRFLYSISNVDPKKPPDEMGYISFIEPPVVGTRFDLNYPDTRTVEVVRILPRNQVEVRVCEPT